MHLSGHELCFLAGQLPQTAAFKLLLRHWSRAGAVTLYTECDILGVMTSVEFAR